MTGAVFFWRASSIKTLISSSVQTRGFVGFIAIA
jgi:hypothetical protein